MNVSWTIGFIVGLLVAAVLCGIALRKAMKNGSGKGRYDERQQAARGKAFTWAYATLLIYLALWMIPRTMEVPFFMEGMSVWLGALISIGVFVGYCIFHDAYFKTSESPRAWIGVICGIGLLNLGIGISRLFRGETIAERLYDNMSLVVGALLTAILICILIKRAIDRRGAED